MEWHYVQSNGETCAVSDVEIKTLIVQGVIMPETLVWKESFGETWQPASETVLKAMFIALSGAGFKDGISEAEVIDKPRYAPKAIRKLFYWGMGLMGVDFLVVIVGLLVLVLTMPDAETVLASDNSRISEMPEVSSGLLIAVLAGGAPIVIMGLIGGAFLTVSHYRCWAVIQGRFALITPGIAVGLLFVPFFNLYWMYVAWVGLAKDMKSYCQEHSIDYPKSCTTVSLWWYILSLIGILPVVGMFVSLPAMILGLIMMLGITKAGENILAAQHAAHSDAATTDESSLVN